MTDPTPRRPRRLAAALLGSALALAATGACAATGRGVMLMNRIGPSRMQLFVSDADGSHERALLPRDGVYDYDPTFSYDGKWVVFTSERDSQGEGQADIYRVHPDGSGLERLTRTTSMEDAGVLSPDDSKLAYVSTQGGARTTNIWVMDLKTRTARNLTGNGSSAPPSTMNGYFRPSWSPDGKWIAFSSDHGQSWAGAELGAGIGHSQPLSIYLVHPDGTGMRRLTATALALSTGSPRWSADGRSLLVYQLPTKETFQARMHGFGSLPAGEPSQILRIDVATGAVTPMTSGPGLKVAPQDLPGGRVGWLVKGRDKAGAFSQISYSDGGHGARGDIGSPSWSPDGKEVVYYKFDPKNRSQYTKLYSWNKDWDYRYTDVFPGVCPKAGRLVVTDLNFPFGNPDASVSVMNPDGTDRKLIFQRHQAAAMMPSWSPDCQWVAVGYGAFFNGRDHAPANILLVKADGSEVKELTQGAVNTGFPAWSPDGRTIVYRVWGKELGLRAMNLTDHSVKTLTTEWDNFPYFSPSGDRIVFTRRLPSKDFDVFTMKSDGTDIQRLTSTPGADAHASWTADGKGIWFESSRTGFKDEAVLYDTSPQPYAQIFLMNRDGSNVRQYTDSKWEDSMGIFLPRTSAAAPAGRGRAAGA